MARSHDYVLPIKVGNVAYGTTWEAVGEDSTDAEGEVVPVGTWQELLKLRELVKMGEAVVEDFLPNIGQCALQDYGRLNEFLTKAKKL